MIDGTNAPTTPETPAKRTIRRRITFEDATAIAEHVARGLTETDSVWLVLNRRPEIWFNWKKRVGNARKCNELFARMRSNRVNNLVENIEVAAVVDKAKAANVRHDWRAAQFLAGVVDPNFRVNKDSANVTTNNTVVVASVGGEDALRKLVEQYAKAALPAPASQSVIDCPVIESPATDKA